MKNLNALQQLLAVAICSTLPTGLWAQQNIVTGSDGTTSLSPTTSAPAFGAVIDYDDSSFLINGWTRSDYASYPQISNLPTVYLTTSEGETLDYSNKTETYYQASIVIVDKSGTMKQRNEATTFRGRGNATWNSGSYKKPWRLKFPSKTSLLAQWDMAKGKEVEPYADAKSWTLLSNPFDKSMIRNAVSNELGQLVGLPFCPAYQFVDLVLNGEYYGTYQISDHMEVAKKRVYVGSKNDWFLELCDGMYGEDPQFSTNGCHFNIKNPDDDTDAAAQMKDYMAKVVQAVNSKSGLGQYVDLASLADYLMGMDMTSNYDGAKGNGYCYKGIEEGDKLKWGPLWDLDLGYGNVGGWASASNVDTKHFWEVQSGYYDWFFKAIYQSPEFQKVFYPRWKAVYEAGLAKNLNKKVDAIYKTVKASAILNYTKGGHTVNQWNYEKWSMGVNNMGLKYNDSHDATTVAADYATAIQQIKDFITTHTAWLNQQYKADYEAITGLKADEAQEPADDADDEPSEDDGDNTGDNSGDNTGDNTSGNTGDNTGDNTGGNSGSTTATTATTYTATLGEWQYVQIPASAFSASATSAELKVTGACYARYMTGINWNYTNVPGGEFAWNDQNKSGVTLTITDQLLQTAKQGNLCVTAGGGSPITLTVICTTGTAAPEAGDAADDNTGDDTGEENTGDNTGDDNTGDDTGDNTGDNTDDNTGDNTGDDSADDNTGDNTGDDSADDNTGDDTPASDESGDQSTVHTYNATITNGYFNIPAADLLPTAQSIHIAIEGTDGIRYIWVKYAVNGATAQWCSGVYYCIPYVWGTNKGEFTITEADRIALALQNGINILTGFKTATITLTCSTEAAAPGRPNAIEEVIERDVPAQTFDLMGRQTSEPKHGLLIQNGRAILIK